MCPDMVFSLNSPEPGSFTQHKPHYLCNVNTAYIMLSYAGAAQLPVAIYSVCFQDTNLADFFRKPKFSFSVK